jgi:hypothetical protein
MTNIETGATSAMDRRSWPGFGFGLVDERYVKEGKQRISVGVILACHY